MNTPIAVIGSGGWGTAISILLAEKGYHVRLWSYFQEESQRLEQFRENRDFLPGVQIPDGVSFTCDLEACVNGCELMICASPSHTVRSVMASLAPFYREDAVLLNIAKGLEEDTHLRLSQVILEEIPQARLAVMSGPSHAEEVSRGVPTANVVAAQDMRICRFVQDIFMAPQFRVYTSGDIAGVEMGGALKNCIALCAGIIDGIGYGDNTKAALMTRALPEMVRLGTKLGAKRDTFYGLAGMGDLIVTCTSMHSRNRRAGILIGQGKSLKETLSEVKMVVEGVKTTRAAYALAKRAGVEMPIVNEAYAVLYRGKNPKTAVNDLMCRDKKDEWD